MGKVAVARASMLSFSLSWGTVPVPIVTCARVVVHFHDPVRRAGTRASPAPVPCLLRFVENLPISARRDYPRAYSQI